MTDNIFSLLSTYGTFGLFICTYLSCLLVPIPTSLFLLAGGALIATGDISAPTLMLAGFCGAVLGDQTGYFIGRKAGRNVLPRLKNNPARAKVITRAQSMVEKRGGLGVFLSTSIFAPLGPYVNLVAGAAELSWVRFTICDMLGEAFWVSAYVGMGYIFVDNLEIVAEMASDIIGILVAVGVGLAALVWLTLTVRAAKAAEETPSSEPISQTSLP